MKSIWPLALLVLMAIQPTNYVLWMLLLFASGICTYVFWISEPTTKKKAPARAGTPNKRNGKTRRLASIITNWR